MNRNKQLSNDYMRDLIVDIRCARRDNMPEYADKCINEFRVLWASRQHHKISRYGIPLANWPAPNIIKWEPCDAL